MIEHIWNASTLADASRFHVFTLLYESLGFERTVGMCVRRPLRHNLNYLAIWMKAMQHQNFPLSLVVSFLVRMTSAQLTSVWDEKKKRKTLLE